MTTTVITNVPTEALDEAWQLYCDMFHRVDELAVQRQAMYRIEFDQVMRDERVRKYLYHHEEDGLCGLATITNDLHAVPLVSWSYFKRRWPKHFAEQRIWYIGFMAVNSKGTALNVFQDFLESMYKTVAMSHGIVALDTCRHRAEVGRLPDTILHCLRRLTSQAQMERLDEEIYWLYEFPGIPATPEEATQ